MAAAHPKKIRKSDSRNSICSPCRLKDHENIAKHQLRMRSRRTNLKLLEISILKQISIPLPKNKSSGGGKSQSTKKPSTPERDSAWVNRDPGRVRNPRMVPGLPNQVLRGRSSASQNLTDAHPTFHQLRIGPSLLKRRNFDCPRISLHTYFHQQSLSPSFSCPSSRHEASGAPSPSRLFTFFFSFYRPVNSPPRFLGLSGWL